MESLSPPGSMQADLDSTRPWFCRVEAETFEEMYGIQAEDVNDFAIDCCHQQIEVVYGDRSLEQIRFDQAVGF